jgi:hypothetical protein
MIHILIGGNTLNKSIYIKELTKNSEVFVYGTGNIDKEIIMSHANNISLFNESPAIILEDILKESEIVFSNDDLTSLKESATLFILKEEKLLVSDQKKYIKFCKEIKNFEEKKEPITQKFNIFNLTDAFAKRDKMTTWLIYRQGLESGLEPEAISGVLFWKIKTMILNGNRFFDKKELIHQSSQIVSLYHRAHRGEGDFSIGLEQFILNSLSSK